MIVASDMAGVLTRVFGLHAATLNSCEELSTANSIVS